MRVIELRCPNDPRQLFAKVLAEGSKPSITGENLVEFSCSECRRELRRSGESVSFVLHRFDLAGEMVETVIVR